MHEIVSETLHEIVDPLVYAEAADLIEEHRAAGREIVIVSSSGAEMVEPIGEMLGADRVVATRMVTADGRYTGEIEFYAYADNKAAAIAPMLAEASNFRIDFLPCFAWAHLSDNCAEADYMPARLPSQFAEAGLMPPQCD